MCQLLLPFFDSLKNLWYNIIMKKKTVKPGWAEFVNAASLFFMYSWKELISMAQIGIRITDQEKQVLADCAAANDLTISQILRSLIRRFIKENENDTDTKRSRV